MTVATTGADDQTAGGAEPGPHPHPSSLPPPCRKQGPRLLHYLSSDSLTALTLTNQPWVGLSFIYLLTWGLSRGLVWFWIKFTFHIYSEVWQESRKYKKIKIPFPWVIFKGGKSHTFPTAGREQVCSVLGEEGSPQNKTQGQSGQPWGRERQAAGHPMVIWGSPSRPHKGRGQDRARVHQMTTHPGPGLGRFPSKLLLGLSLSFHPCFLKEEALPTPHLTHAWI